MSKIKEKDIREIRRAVEKEFPEDPALQQVHIARKIVAKEAQLEGLSFLEYVKLLGKEVKNVTQRLDQLPHKQGSENEFYGGNKTAR